MNSSLKRSRSRLKPLVVALTLALPTIALAVSTDVVKTRADQNIDQQYGRDSVYGFSLESKPLSPERTSGSHSLKWFHQADAADANVSAPYTGYVPQQQEGMDAGSGYTNAASDDMNAGSGYTDSETMAQADTIPTALGQFSSDNALVGEAQGQWESGSVLVLPVALNDDGTASQYDRGYYRDPDQSDIIIILPDIVAMTGDQSASSEEGTPADTD